MRLPPMPLGEHVVHDYRALGLSLKAHPVSFLRGGLDAEGVTPNARLPDMSNGRRICVAGLVLIRQRPGTSKGVIFMTLEDETGIANIVVWHKIFERFRPQVLGARFVRIAGRLQVASGVVHLIAERIEDLSARLGILVRDGRQMTDYMRIGGKRPAAQTRANPHAPRQPLERVAPPAQSDAAAVMPKGRNFH